MASGRSRCVAALVGSALCLGLAWADDEPGFTPIFNGKDLSGWEGDPALWSVREGAITGVTTDEAPLPYNKFLIWRAGSPKNFELRSKVRLVGKSNSGIQYRSKQLPDAGEFVVGGYQADIHPTPENNGMLYDERGRGILAMNGQKVVIDPEGQRWVVGSTGPVEPIKLDDWNDYAIVAKGNHLVHKINGRVVADIVDHDASDREMEGLLALQVHRGSAMTVQFKEMMLKPLPDGGLIAFDQAQVPEGAEKAGAKKAASKKGDAPKKDAPKKKADAPKAEAKQKGRESRVATEPPPAGVEPRTPEATQIDSLKVREGFKVELLYSVPEQEQGSWVAMTLDPKGRLIVSDQYGKLYRVTPPPLEGPTEAIRIEPIAVEIGEAQGLLWAFDSLYVVVNTAGKFQSGLYRVRDTDGDDQLDKVEQLRALEGKGEHGPHAILLAPDGRSLCLIAGNGTKLTAIDDSRVTRAWGEDHLLPRMSDGRGFMRDVMAPGGCVYHLDPDGKTWELVSSGYRNPYDMAFNRDGELFAYDADMEWDLNTPWYRPTRVCHVVSGSEFGWRNGAGKWPPYFPDSLPAAVNIGYGSPTGVVFGFDAKFPAKYREALYICDWSYGKLYAVHLKPDGASYTGEFEEFITGVPLPLTDILVRPQDGALYFAIGGRKTKSGLYRVTYAGNESTAPAEPDRAGLEARVLRRKLESFHGHQDPKAVETAWPQLGSPDRFIRWAARVAIEHQPVGDWQDRALAERDPQASLEALIALARLGDDALQTKLLKALDRLEWSSLDRMQKLAILRAYGLAFIRMGKPDAADAAKVAGRFDPYYPAEDRELNAELCKMLVYLQAPDAAAKTVKLMESAPTQEEQIEYAMSLRDLREGWTPALRGSYFSWFRKAANYRGGASFSLYVKHIKDDAIATLSESERTALAPILEAPAEPDPRTAAVAPRDFVKDWTVDELVPLVDRGLKGRDFERGRSLFAAASCYSCHRFNNEGGAVGPDLSGVSGRFSPRDLLVSIIQPSKEISDQYAAVDIATVDGRVITGRIVNLHGDTFHVNTDMTNPEATTNVDRKQVEEMRPSPVSMMPQGLLNTLKPDEVLDLVAYLLSRGDRKSEMFAGGE